MTSDPFGRMLRGWDTPYESSESVAANSADHEFDRTTRALLFLGNGDVTVRLAGDSADLTFTVDARRGFLLPVRATHVKSGTTIEVIGLF